MDRLTPNVVSRCAAVVPFKPRSGVPTVEIGGKRYVLSTDGGPLGDAADPLDHGMFGYGEPEEGQARLIETPKHLTPFRFLWAYDTDRKTLGMWRVTDGNEKHFGPANSEQARIVSLTRKGELNRVTSHEMEAITHDMRRREDVLLEELKRTIEENKSDFDHQVGKLCFAFYEHEVKAKIENAIHAAKSGAVPFGFKPFGPGVHEPHARLRQTISHVVGETFRREMSREKVVAYLERHGLDTNVDPQAVDFAISEVLDKVYEDHLPPYAAGK